MVEAVAVVATDELYFFDVNAVTVPLHVSSCAGAFGGALHLSGGASMMLDSSVLSHNAVEVGPCTRSPVSGGGAVFVGDSSSLVSRNTSFLRNTVTGAAQVGAAVLVASYADALFGGDPSPVPDYQ